MAFTLQIQQQKGNVAGEAHTQTHIVHIKVNSLTHTHTQHCWQTPFFMHQMHTHPTGNRQEKHVRSTSRQVNAHLKTETAQHMIRMKLTPHALTEGHTLSSL